MRSSLTAFLIRLDVLKHSITHNNLIVGKMKREASLHPNLSFAQTMMTSAYVNAYTPGELEVSLESVFVGHDPIHHHWGLHLNVEEEHHR